MSTMLKVREVSILAATAGEKTAMRGRHRLAFTASSMHEFVRSQPAEKVPLLRAHGTDVAAYCGYVRSWALGPDGRTLLASALLTRDIPLAVGDPVSLGIDHRSRIQEDTGTKLITGFTIRELSLDLSSKPAMPSARVLSIGPWLAVPDAGTEASDLAAEADARSRWEAAGGTWGSSSGVFVPTKAPRVLYSTRSD